MPLVTDFGLAKRFEGRHEAELTQSGSIVGTPGYMAPEQAEGRREAITTAVDIHALGAILFELLTGRPPFRAETVLETLRMVREQEPVRPGRSTPRIDRDLETIVLKCLEKSPEPALPLGAGPGRRPRALARRFTDPGPSYARFAPRRQVGTPPAGGGALLALMAPSPFALAIVGSDRRGAPQERRRQERPGPDCRARETPQVRGRAGRVAPSASCGWKKIGISSRSLPPTKHLRAKDPATAERLLADCPPRLRNWEWRHLSRRLHPEVLDDSGPFGTRLPRLPARHDECAMPHRSDWPARSGTRRRLSTTPPDAWPRRHCLWPGPRSGRNAHGHGRIRRPGQGLGHDSGAVAPRLPRSRRLGRRCRF